MTAQTSIEESRLEFLRSADQQEREITMKRTELARSIVQRMADGEPFTHADFIFAATLGETSDHAQEASTLGGLAQLNGGELVATTRAGVIWELGRVSTLPLSYDTRVTGGTNSERFLQVTLHYSFGVRRATNDARFPKVDIEPMTGDQLSVPILTSYSEPERYLSPTYNQSAFYESKEVAVGEARVINLVSQQSDGSAEQMLECYIQQLHTHTDAVSRLREQ